MRLLLYLCCSRGPSTSYVPGALSARRLPSPFHTHTPHLAFLWSTVEIALRAPHPPGRPLRTRARTGGRARPSHTRRNAAPRACVDETSAPPGPAGRSVLAHSPAQRGVRRTKSRGYTDNTPSEIKGNWRFEKNAALHPSPNSSSTCASVIYVSVPSKFQSAVPK